MTNALPGVTDGAWYSCLTDELESLRHAARTACFEHGTMHPSGRGGCGPALRDILAEFAEDAMIEAPFHCAYGLNLHISEGVYINSGAVILDTARVTIGARSLLGPGVHIYCADHHRDPARRREGMERALPVAIGADVWIGGRAVILPGVMIGEGAIVAAGAVVSRDVAPGATVAGVPARPA